MNYMGQSKRDYMESHDGLADRYYNIILEKLKKKKCFTKHYVTLGLIQKSNRLMSYNRSLDYLNHKQIIYRTIPRDKPTKRYDWGLYYEDGTYDCYDLFRSKAKITTYKSLKWHLLVLWYLNPQLTPDDFQQLAEVICYRQNGFITFNVSQQLLKTNNL